VFWFISLYTTDKTRIDPSAYTIVDQVEDVEIRAQELIAIIESSRADNNIIIISAHDDASASFLPILEQYFFSIGLNNSLSRRFRYAYIAILDGDKVIFEGLDEELLNYSLRIEQMRVEVESAGLSAVERGRGASILINDNEYSLGMRGLNIVIFDKEYNEVTDSINIDTYSGLSMVSASSMSLFDDEMESSLKRRLWFGFGQILLLFIGILCLFAMHFNKVNANPAYNKSLVKECFTSIKRTKINFIIMFVAIALLPNIFLYYLYNTNYLRNNLLFSHSFFLSILFAIISVIFFLFVYIFTKCRLSALISSILFWFVFWFYAFSYEQVVQFSEILPSAVFFSMVIMYLVLIVLLLRAYGPFLSIDGIVFNVFCFVIITLFLFNFIPAINHEVSVHNNTINRHLLNDADIFNLNRNFVVDNSLQHPDIYWIHLDNVPHHLLMYELFNIDTEIIRYELYERSFIIYENEVYLYAGLTGIALPALFSPDFYDYILGELMIKNKELTDGPRALEIYSTLSQKGIITDYIELFRYLELHHALMSASYALITLGIHSNYAIWSPFDIFYDLGSKEGRIARFSNYYNETFLHSLYNSNTRLLLAMTTPLSLILSSELPIPQVEWDYFRTHIVPNYSSDMEMRMYNALIDSYSIPSPRFVFIFNDFAHHSHWGWVSDRIDVNADNLEIWIYAYNYALEVTLNTIDIILANNSDAVIIIQSDHGLRGTWDWLSHSDVLRVQDSVFSAVRIPETYGGLDAPIHPLNITRELVNRFVGSNYSLLE